MQSYELFQSFELFQHYAQCMMQEEDFCLSKLRSGTHGLNEVLGKHRGKKGKTECFCVEMSVRM